MGVNVWLMKGFFDTIPAELDESARVDGATPAQVFWGVILPLAAPVLAVVGLISFIGMINEFVIASASSRPATSSRSRSACASFIDQQYGGALGRRSPRASCSRRSAGRRCSSSFLQKFIVCGLTGGAVKG